MIRLAVVLAFIGSAHAQTPCGPREAILKQALDKWHESPVLTGTAASGTMAMEFLVSPDRTWTVILTDTTDRSCVVASGRDLIILADPPKPGKGM